MGIKCYGKTTSGFADEPRFLPPHLSGLLCPCTSAHVMRTTLTDELVVVFFK